MAEKKATKYFRIAVEGDTVDGRTIQRSWITDSAETYNTHVYAARINIEHINGLSPDSPFKAYGDVVSLQAREEKGGPFDGKMALYAQISPTDELVELNKKRQKMFTSCEFAPQFAKTGKCYLVGLAVTDNPASLGTEFLQFSAQNPATSPLTARKKDPQNVFSAATHALELEFSTSENPETGAGILDTIRALFSQSPSQKPDNRENMAELTSAVKTVATHSAENQTAIAELRKQLADLETKLFSTPNTQPLRPIISGGGGGSEVVNLTDC